MSTCSTSGTRRGRSRLRPLIWGGAALLLLLPTVAMRFTAQVEWTASDFMLMGVMLAAACGICELALWLSGDPVYRAAYGIAVATGFLTVWVNLAVGMFGSENSAINLMFAGVLLVAAMGSLLAGFQPRGMARAMAATAAAQLLAAALGLAIGLAAGTDEGQGRGLAWETFLTACFAAPWLASAQLFRKAAQRQAAFSSNGTPA
ncbi:MAG TPA: hypothetical protein VEY92_10725 [Pseudoxanthomonas sp.]|nr:hypothetical protein [Pseudoxanthomonas sp.]